MQEVRSADALQRALKTWESQALKTGFVPTMGALHEGHISLVRIALKNADRVIVSVFVNPAQFAPHEDFASYPRDEAGDLARLEQSGAHLVYLPTQNDIYPNGQDTSVKAGAAGKGLESDFRPHFFDGVVNVVHRLFEQVRPDVAVFGEKDYQQLMVIREMVEALALPVNIIGGPIVRDEAGLALSSRNAYLSADELKIARRLNTILKTAAQDGDLKAAQQELLEAGFDKVDYVSTRWNRILAAAWVGKTRLIDNMAPDN